MLALFVLQIAWRCRRQRLTLDQDLGRLLLRDALDLLQQTFWSEIFSMSVRSIKEGFGGIRFRNGRQECMEGHIRIGNRLNSVVSSINEQLDIPSRQAHKSLLHPYRLVLPGLTKQNVSSQITHLQCGERGRRTGAGQPTLVHLLSLHVVGGHFQGSRRRFSDCSSRMHFSNG